MGQRSLWMKYDNWMSSVWQDRTGPVVTCWMPRTPAHQAGRMTRTGPEPPRLQCALTSDNGHIARIARRPGEAVRQWEGSTMGMP